jgi:DNA/RNA endonuclease YhcR with UshA esterase domain
MKKIIYSLFVLAMAAFTFSSCEDVPAPYDMPTKPETPELQPTGSGTAADPFNIAAVEKYIDEGGSAETEIYVKGKVVSVKQGSFDPQYGSLKYYISEDGTATNQFYVYNGYAGPNRTKFSGEDALKPGDEVVICGKVDNYQGTKEFLVGNYIVSLNGQGGTTTPDTPAGEAKGTGIEADPFNSVAANNLATSLGSGEVSDKEYYIKGKIQEIKDQFAAQFGNATFYIADDENSQKFLIFRTYYFGGEKWKEGDGQLKIGDEVVVCAKLINYMGNTPETNQGGKLISVNGKTSIEGGSETPDTPSTGDTTTPNGDFETWVDGKPNNWKTASTACNATLTQSTDAHNGKYSVKVGGSTTANKRLGYKEMELKAGTYKIKYYVKAATATGASVQSGFVDITAEGKAGNYVYSGYINDIPNTKWTLVEQELVIPADGKYCIVIMNAKKPGGDVLIDNLTLTLGETVIIK